MKTNSTSPQLRKKTTRRTLTLLLVGAALLLRPQTSSAGAFAYTYAYSEGSSQAVEHTDGDLATTDESANPQDAIANAGGASAFAHASVSGRAIDDEGTIVGTNIAPNLHVKASSQAGGDENAVAATGIATGSWADVLSFDNPNIVPPAYFLQLYAVFHCHIGGRASGPIGAAYADMQIIIDHTDYNGDHTSYGHTVAVESPKSISTGIQLAVPVNLFIPGNHDGSSGPKLTMGISAVGQSVYDPSEGMSYVGDGIASFGDTFSLETIYFADEHGNPVSGFDQDFQIVGQSGPYAMGPPPEGFLNEMVVLDRFGRRVNERGITLVDWEGQIANPAIGLTVVPPSDTIYPATATVSCPQGRVYFDEPSTVDASGSTKTLTFTNSTPLPLSVSIFPDADGVDEDWPITIMITSSNGATRTLYFNAHVVDQDQPTRPIEFPVTVDFSHDQTGFFSDSTTRSLYQQLANDWSYFFADPGLDTVPPGAETTFIWNSDGFNSGTFVTNSNAYRGYLLYAYGIDQATEPYRSGGEPSSAGGFLTTGGTNLNLRRSGGQELEVKGNYNTFGWYVTTNDDDWWKASNLGNVQNDLASVAHHEMGHAFIFNAAQPAYANFKSLGFVQDDRVHAYQGIYPGIDPSDHLTNSVDRLSGKGAFGNEYYGMMPARRWLITKLDLLVAQAVGYALRPTSAFLPAAIIPTTLPRGGVGGYYSRTLQGRGGIPFYRWSISSGSLPPGLSLDSFTGAITGTPTTVGTYAFGVSLEEYDDAAAPVTGNFSIRIEATPFQITSVKANPTVQISYLTATNHTYTVEYSEDLEVWNTLASGVVGTGGEVTTSDPAGPSRHQRFYRIEEM